MKPVTYNNLSFLGAIGLLVLFNLPYVGGIAFIVCLLFVKDKGVKRLALGYLIASFLFGVVLGILMVFGGVTPNDFDFMPGDGIEVFRNLKEYFGI